MRFLLVLLLIPSLSFAQQSKDTKVILTATDTANLFNRVVMAFYERGYTLEQKDDALQFVATAEHSIPREAVAVKLRAMVKGSAVTLTGLSTMELGPKERREYTPIEYRKGRIWKNVHFKEMEEIARAVGGEIAYSK